MSIHEKKFPIAKPSVTDREEANVVSAMRSGWISSRGAYLDEFESRFAELCDVPHALAVSNGTVALHLVLAAAGVGPGDEVIVPSLTYVASANAVRYCGADPVFVDVDHATWCIAVTAIEAAITPNTVAIIAVDIYGHPADYAKLSPLCENRGLLLIADAAEAMSATVDGKPTGGLAPVSTFSFFGNKVVTSGEGGCVTVRDGVFADKMRQLRNQGTDPYRRYHFPVVGFNYRLTNVAAAILCAQLDRLDAMLTQRRALLAAYEAGLQGQGLTSQHIAPGVQVSPWLAAFLLPETTEGRLRDEFMEHLLAAGVETRPFFEPLHMLPPYASARISGDLRVTRDLAARGFNLPTYVDLQVDEVFEICERVSRVLRQLRIAA